MEVTNPAFRMANQNVLAKAPCSIGILLERRLSEDAIEPDDSGMLTVETENKRGKWCDVEYVSEFRIQTAHDESRSYNEKAVNNATVSVLVVQQHVKELGTPHAPAQPEEQFSNVQIMNRPMGKPVFNTKSQTPHI
uniref:Uncharacterized protein n=1 Tax=Salix viminalis TaxID=40686 RepID=A0A6N2KVG5_SALVM